MKYYLHYSNSFQDEKITKLYIKYGYEGLGLFYTLLEKLAIQEKPIDNEVLKKQLNIGKKLEKVWNYMQEIELISSKNGETFNENLLNFSEKYKIKKEKTRKKVSDWRERQIDEKNVTNNIPIRNSPKLNKTKLNKIKKRNIKEIITYLNEKTNKSFGINSKASEKLITARLNDKFTIEDFKKVIDNKCKSWLGTEYDKYLRPETLFCATHFESYLNEKPQKTGDEIAEDFLKKRLEDENKRS